MYEQDEEDGVSLKKFALDIIRNCEFDSKEPLIKENFLVEKNLHFLLMLMVGKDYWRIELFLHVKDIQKPNQSIYSNSHLHNLIQEHTDS